MKSPLALIISREYLERVKRKSFIISTLLTPLFMIGIMTIPALIAIFSEADEQTVGVVDLSEQHIGSKLEKAGEITFVDGGDDLKAAMGNEDFDCVLLINEDAVSRPDGIALYSHEAASMQSEAAISGQLENIIEKERMKAYEIAILAPIMKEAGAYA
ncbi:MAG: ABC transporter permease, partial [Muribaculaceae bacterium]|nr:ABC transporter permease [Muribaculaceae bacterium]